jgi:HupE / UreJ protein
MPGLAPQRDRTGAGARGPRARAASAAALVGMAFAFSLAVIAGIVPAASAHVVPTSTIQLAVHEKDIAATVAIPLSDVEAATGLDLGTESQAAVRSEEAAIDRYLLAHFAPTSDAGGAWTVSPGELQVSTTGGARTTGRYRQLETTFTLIPPAGSNAGSAERSFNLGYTAVVDRVATHVVVVTVRSDWSSGTVDNAYEVGAIQRNTVTDKVEALHVDLGPGSEVRGFISMFELGMHHIREGVDHQLFLLTLLLPAPLLARGRRWSGAVPGRRALRRITATTISFTIGHSLTLALGALGVPAPSALIEALIAVSILVAEVHAIRPVFAGREALVAGAFGLVHGLAFSETLRALDLTGSRLVLSLLGFNLGIEAMQLVVVTLVLPPLVMLAGSGRYRGLRLVAATATAVAAVGWLGARLGVANPIASAADHLGVISVPAVMVLWLIALSLARHRSRWIEHPRGAFRAPGQAPRQGGAVLAAPTGSEVVSSI